MSHKRKLDSDPVLTKPTDKKPDLHILVADAERIEAHYDILRLFSRRVQDLPKPKGKPCFTKWDLRSLVLEGQREPASKAVATQWRDYIYSQVDSSRKLQPFRKLQDAKPLLLFADAVGTSDAAMQKLCAMLTRGSTPAAGGGSGSTLRLEVPLNPQQTRKMEVLLQGRLYRSAPGEGLVYVNIGTAGVNAGDDNAVLAIKPGDFEPHRVAFTSALVGQLESWLHLAGRLKMVPLVRLLMGFVKRQLVAGSDCVLGDNAGEVFSARVLQSMPRGLLLEGFLRDALLCRPSDMQLLVQEAAAGDLGYGGGFGGGFGSGFGFSGGGSGFGGGRGNRRAIVVEANVLTAEAAAAARLEGTSSCLSQDGMVSCLGLQPSASRSQLVLGPAVEGEVEVEGEGAPYGSGVLSLNVSVGGYNAERCKQAVRAAVQRAMAE